MLFAISDDRATLESDPGAANGVLEERVISSGHSFYKFCTMHTTCVSMVA